MFSSRQLSFQKTTYIVAIPFSLLTLIYFFLYQSSGYDLVIGGALTAAILGLNTPKFRHVLPYLLYGLVALHIHQSQGMVMLHFEVFILIGILILYSDWVIVLHTLIAAAIHHVGFFFMQFSGIPVYIFPTNENHFSMVIEHCLYAIMQASVSMYGCYVLNRSMTRIQYVTEVVDHVVEKDKLNLNVTLLDNDEFYQKFNQIIIQLQNTAQVQHQTISSLKEISDRFVNDINIVDKEVSANALSTEMVATAIEELGNAFGSVSESMQACSDSTEHAEQLTDKSVTASNVCQQDLNTLTQGVEQTKSNIKQVVDDVQAIHRILQTITDISEQTNLLALNASIEAARAGESGRGFAVVADEVRQLATRTNTSVDEISGSLQQLNRNINSSTTTIDNMATLSQSVAQSLHHSLELTHEITKDINDINAQMYQITSAATEQNTALEQINQTMADVYRSSSVVAEQSNQQKQSTEVLSHNIEQLVALSNKLSYHGQ